MLTGSPPFPSQNDIRVTAVKGAGTESSQKQSGALHLLLNL